MHLYKDCKIKHGDFIATVQWVMRYGVVADYECDNSRFKSQFGEFKPILRYLHDITEAEQAEWDKISTTIGEMAIESALQIHWAKRLNFYRSIGIDCDGLLDSGQAIDKKTLK